MAMAECIAETKGWTEANKIKLNIPKTDVLIAHDSSIQPELPVDVGDVTITPSKAVRNLGIIIDSNLSLEPHVSNLCRRAFYHIRRISQIRRFLDKDTTARLVSAFVTSTLDNGNSILYGLPKKSLDRLQSVQNSAVRLINGTKRREHITPQLQELHWLPVASRIDFKIATLVYCCISGSAPSYLCELIELQVPSRPGLRSNQDALKLVVRKNRKKKYGERAFFNCAPRVWNNLPLSIRSLPTLQSFKTQLKSHYFRTFFNLPPNRH